MSISKESETYLIVRIDDDGMRKTFTWIDEQVKKEK
jgi:hypothetical protein